MSDASTGPPTADASVVICAYSMERWTDLVDLFAGLGRQTLAPREVFLVIDHHDDLLARSARTFGDFPGLRVIENDHKRGASGARNAGIELAKGSIIVFLDDDAVPDDDWLERLLAPYDTPHVYGVGGYASPVWPEGAGRPAHMVGELDWIVGCTYRGQPTELTAVRNLVACNMSVRREVFDIVGYFDEEVGRIGKLPLGCEETELCIRVTQQVPGAILLFEPRAAVRHRVPQARRTWAYLRQRSLAEGLSKAYIASTVGAQDATDVERDYVRRVLTAAVRRELGRGFRGQSAGFQGAAGVVVSLGSAGIGYVRGRLGAGGGSAVNRAADAARGA